jgi:hypothetical protein
MASECVGGKIESGVKPPQSKKEGSGISREDAKARRVGDRGNAESKGSEWRVAGGGWRVARDSGNAEI